VFPDWLRTDEQGFKQINLERLNAVLVNAVKEQQTEIETQRTEIGVLKARLDKLEQSLAARAGQR